MATYICIYPSGYSLSSAELARYGATHRYTSMAAMEAGEDVDWVTAADNPVVEIIGGDGSNNWSTAGADTTTATFSGWTLSQTYYLTIKTIGTARNSYSDGKWSSSAYRIEVADGHGLNISNPTSTWCVLDGIQIKITGTTNYRNTLYIDDNIERVEVRNCYLITESTGTGTNAVEYIPDAGSELAYFWNNIITGGVQGIWQRSGTMHTYHNTVYGFSGDAMESDGMTSYSVNNAVFGNGDDFQDTFTTINYCASDDGDGTNAVDLNENASSEWDNGFVDWSNADFRVKDASSLLYDAGGSISSWTTLDGDSDPLAADIKGDTRSTDDIGAFVYVSSASSIPAIMHHRQNQGVS